MALESDPRLVVHLRSASRAAAALVIIIPCLVLVGWTFDLLPIKQLFPNTVAMNPLTAVLFIACGTARLVPPRRAEIVSRVLGAFVVAAGAITLVHLLTRRGIGLDQILFRHHLAETTLGVANRMAPNTAAAFVLIGVALLLDDETRRRSGDQVVAMLANIIALAALLGYIYKGMGLVGVTSFIPMAVHSAICFLLISGSILFAHPERGLMAVIAANDAGGVLARRLLPAVVLVPPILGWLRDVGQVAGLYNRETGLSLAVMLTIALFAAGVWWTAGALHRAEIKRQHLEERYRAVIHQAADGIYLVDADSKQIVESNPALDRLLGYDPGGTTGRSVCDIIADDPRQIEARMRRMLTSASVLTGERPYRRKDGSVVEVESSAAVIRYNGRPVLCTVVHDITQRKRAEAELRRNNALLARSAEAERKTLDTMKKTQSLLVQTEKLAGLGQMVAGVAHEINNPLAFVSNNVAVLQRDVTALASLLNLYRQGDGALSQSQPQLMKDIQDLSEQIELPYTLGNLGDLLTRTREGLKRIQQIVKDLRDFARLDESDLQQTDINVGVQSAINVVQGLAKKKQVRLEMDLQPVPAITCFPAKVNQVVMNLMSNAIDASPEGGVVTIRTRPNGDGVEMEVTDHGAGIPPEIREKIFDPFFTTKPPGQGTGLGLSISYGIIRDHGGTIAAENSEGGGATFRVTLPRGEIARM